MRASVFRLATCAAVVSLAACGDSATSPGAAGPRPFSSAPSLNFSATSSVLGTTTTDIVVGSQGGSFSVGGLYTLNFPANSICDPARSSYGPTEWDNACVTLGSDQTITLHAVLTLSTNGLAVDFSPALRFNPATEVTISTDIFAPVIRANREFFSKNPSALNPLAILYSPDLGATEFSDYAKDASLVTKVNLGNGRIWRRVKHFSGYSMTSGEACEPAPDNPDCIEVK